MRFLTRHIGSIISYMFLLFGTISWIMTLVGSNLSLNEFNIFLVFISMGAANIRVLFIRVPTYIEILIEAIVVIFLFFIAYEFHSPATFLADIVLSLLLLVSYIEL